LSKHGAISFALHCVESASSSVIDDWPQGAETGAVIVPLVNIVTSHSNSLQRIIGRTAQRGGIEFSSRPRFFRKSTRP
jgi:hypothetical protein